MNRRAMLSTLLVCSMTFGCASISKVSGPLCGPNDRPNRWTEEQIDHMDDAQVKQELARNEELVRRGCAVPN